MSEGVIWLGAQAIWCRPARSARLSLRSRVVAADMLARPSWLIQDVRRERTLMSPAASQPDPFRTGWESQQLQRYTPSEVSRWQRSQAGSRRARARRTASSTICWATSANLRCSAWLIARS